MKPPFKKSAVLGVPIDQLTVDGYDMTWGTNTLGRRFSVVGAEPPVLSVLCVLGPFYFTKLLLPALFKASTPENKSRVVNCSSAGSIAAGSLFGSGLDFATFKDSPRRRKYSTPELYGQSKFVRAAVSSIESIDNTKTFQPGRGMWYSPKNLPGAMRIRSLRLRFIPVSLRWEPIKHDEFTISHRIGIIRSELYRSYVKSDSERSSHFTYSMVSLTGSLGSFSQFLTRMLLYPVPQGALTLLWAGTSPETANLNGEVIPSILLTNRQRDSWHVP